MKTPIDRRCFAASPFARGFGTALLVLPVLAKGCCFQHRRKKTRSTKPGKQVIIACMFSNRQTVMDIPQHPPLILASSSVYRRELLARLRSAVRYNDTNANTQLIEAGDLGIDLSARLITRSGDVLKLTATEYNLLALLASNKGRVLTHQFLLREVWGVSFQAETQYLRVFIAQLRKKLEDDPNRPKHIITESGVGYRFQ